MGWFRKKSGPDVIDLTDMQKRGLLPAAVPEANEQGIVDLSSDSYTQVGSSSSSGDMDFLSGLAGVESHPSPGPVTSGLRAARHGVKVDARVNEMKLKIDDNEYKISQLSEKIMELEEKIKEVKGV